MKKIFKIIGVNIFIFLIIFFAADIFLFIKDVRFNSRSYVFKTPKTFFKYYFETYKRMLYGKNEYDRAFIEGKGANIHFRPVLNQDSPKKPILIMGCSFAYGSALTVEQSFMGKLANLTDRPVYNRAIAARGADEMLYQVMSDKFYSIVPKPEWVIYVFIPDQLRRTQIPCSVVDTGVFYTHDFKIRHDLTFPILYTLKDKINYYVYDKYHFHLNAIIHNIKAYAQQHWGDDVKFAFIYYDNNKELMGDMKKYTENSGYTFYSINDLTPVNLMTPEYKANDNVHPSEDAWNILTPVIVEKLGI